MIPQIFPFVKFSLLAFSLFISLPENAPDGWADSLKSEIEKIDEETPGNLGVYVKYLDDGEALNHNADRHWYLASTIKVPLAVAILQKVENEELSLDEEVTLEEWHFVDGAGDLQWQEPGSSYTLKTLIQKMLENSDSTATDILIGLLSEEELHRMIIENMVSEGFEPFSTILQVRYDAYGELHPSVEKLSNLDFMDLKQASPGEERLQTLLEKLAVEPDELQLLTIEEAFERYYERQLNSGTLEAFGALLERLAEGELLNEEHTNLVLEYMQNITTGDHRIKAGLPEGTPFAQKTGTQVERACNVGIIHPEEKERSVIVAACTEKFGNVENAEQTLQRVGESLANAEIW